MCNVLTFEMSDGTSKLDSGLYPTCRLSVCDLRQDYFQLPHFMIPNEFIKSFYASRVERGDSSGVTGGFYAYLPWSALELCPWFSLSLS